MIRSSILAAWLLAGGIIAQTTPMQPPALQGRAAVRVNPMGDNSPSNNNLNGESIMLAGDRLYVIWSDYVGLANEDIYVAWSDDEGFSFSPMVRVDLGDAAGSATSDVPQIVLVDDGNPSRTLVAVWEENRAARAAGGGALNNDVYYSRSTDGGLTWLPAAQPLNADTFGNRVTDVDRITIAVDGTSVHVAWEEQLVCNQCYEVLRYARSDDGGQTWTAPVTLNTQVSRPTPNPRINVNDVNDPKITARNGRVVIVFGDDRNDPFEPLESDLFTVFSPDGGNNWVEIPLETNTMGDARDLQIARDGATVVATWIDTETIGGGGVRAAVSIDDGFSWGPEIVISPVLESTFPMSRATQCDVDVFGNDIIVTWADDRLLVPGTSDVRRAYYSYSNDGGSTWTTDLNLDPGSLRFNQRPTVDIVAGAAFVFFEINAFGSNRAAYTVSRDGGATFTATTIISVGAGTDVDTPSQHEGTFFVASETKQKAWVVLRDRPLGRNEVYLSGVSAPHMTVAGGTDTNGQIQVTTGSTVRFALRGAPAAATNDAVLFGIGLTDSAPATPVGNGVLLHLVPDLLTFDLLANAVFSPVINATIGPDGSADGVAFPWPLPVGTPPLYGAAIVVSGGGQVTYGSDPVQILTQ